MLMTMKTQMMLMLLLATGATTVLGGGGGSCAAARKCCDGRDPDCAAGRSDEDEDYYDYNRSGESCFCDQGCLDMGDCCSDFKDYCGVIDCVVSEWSAWSSCDSDCGRGVARRSRHVIHPAANGGMECEALEQTRSCTGEGDCSRKNRATLSAFSETAMLLPGKYIQKRVKKYDVRHNLKTFQPVDSDDNSKYCVVFTVDKASKACLLAPETHMLTRGSEVCVACESKAVRDHLGDRCTGHGVEGKSTRFKNVITPACHGKWVRVRVEDECPCKHGPHFIFV